MKAGDTPVPFSSTTASSSIGVEEAFGFVPKFSCPDIGKNYERIEDAACELNLSLDWSALNVFFRTGFFLNGSTPFREIRRYSPEPVICRPISLSRDAAIDAFIEVFRAAVRRRLHRNSVVALSGGRDSRHILLELHAQNMLPRHALTVAIPGRPEEVSIARTVATRVGVAHRVIVPAVVRSVGNEVWKNLNTDFMTMEHGWFVCAARQRDDCAWWEGIAGDVLSASKFLNPRSVTLFEQNRLDELAECVVSNEPLRFLWDFRRLVREDALARVRAELSKHREAPNPVSSFYFWNRTRTVIGASAFGMLKAHGLPVVAPYLDREVWSFLSSLPARMLLDRQFHTDTIRRAYPDSRNIPFYEDQGTPTILSDWLRCMLLVCHIACQPRLWKFAVVARAAQALLDPSKSNRISYLLPQIIYAEQLCKVVSAARSGNGTL